MAVDPPSSTVRNAARRQRSSRRRSWRHRSSDSPVWPDGRPSRSRSVTPAPRRPSCAGTWAGRASGRPSRSRGDRVARVKGLTPRYGPIPALADVSLRPARRRGGRAHGEKRRRQVDASAPPRRAFAEPSEGRSRSSAARPPRSAALRSHPARRSRAPGSRSALVRRDRGGRVRGRGQGRRALQRARHVQFSSRSWARIADGAHPKELSEGQRLALALAIVLAPEPPLAALGRADAWDLTTAPRKRLSRQLRQLAARGHCVVVATHDVELVAEVADRVVVLADGEVITDGPARAVVCRSTGLASQVARILAPARVADRRGGRQARSRPWRPGARRHRDEPHARQTVGTRSARRPCDRDCVGWSGLPRSCGRSSSPRTRR